MDKQMGGRQMSDRPTISVYRDGKHLVCYYMRNWSYDSLLMECIKIIRSIEPAKDIPETMLRLSKDPNREVDVEWLREYESMSDLPATIDLDKRCLYDAYRQAHGKKVMPEVLKEPADYDKAYEDTGDPWVAGRRIPFDMLDHVWERIGESALGGGVTVEPSKEILASVTVGGPMASAMDSCMPSTSTTA